MQFGYGPRNHIITFRNYVVIGVGRRGEYKLSHWCHPSPLAGEPMAEGEVCFGAGITKLTHRRPAYDVLYFSRMSVGAEWSIVVT